MPVTIKDIAKRVGKSVTTVSRALHDFDDVSPETKELVRRVAAEMGYSPNLLAQRLQKRRSDTISLILPIVGSRDADPFLSEFLAGVGEQAFRLGYDLLVSTSPPGEGELEAYQQRIQGGRTDGFAIVRTRRWDPRIDLLREVGFPFVSFGRTDGELDYSFVDEDSRAGMRQVAEHLVGMGHTRIGFIAAPQELTFARHRFEGLREALNDLDAPLQDSLIVYSDLTHQGGFLAAQNLLKASDPPTAIVACNDWMALGAMAAVQENGRVPGMDISITGFDNVPVAKNSRPALTTVHQPTYEIGGMVCEMLVRQILGEEPGPEQRILQPHLMVRQSTGNATSASNA